ncbi:MAG: cell division protein FtsA [Clostridia bacterium]
MRNIIAGIDIGTSKVSTAAGYLNGEFEPAVLGAGISRCSAVKKGQIDDIGEISSAIKDSVSKAEKMANIKILSAFVNIIGMNVEVIKRQVSIQIENRSGLITISDVYRLLNIVGDVSADDDKKVIDIIVQNYKIDDSTDIYYPVGMQAKKLELSADVILSDTITYQNITDCMEKAGIELEGFVLSGLAEGGLILTAEEKEKGVILIDTGAGITDITVIKDNNLLFYNSVPIGGEHITNDLSIVLKTSYNEAEAVKKQYNLAMSSMIENDEEVLLGGQELFSKRIVNISDIVEVIEARVNEIFELSKKKIEDSEIEIDEKWMLVLSGQGVTEFQGALEVAKEIFGTRVRINKKRVSDTVNSSFNTAVGIIKYVSELRRKKSVEIPAIRGHRAKRRRSLWKKIRGLFNK